jgi:hypothetical protein
METSKYTSRYFDIRKHDKTQAMRLRKEKDISPFVKLWHSGYVSVIAESEILPRIKVSDYSEGKLLMTNGISS